MSQTLSPGDSRKRNLADVAARCGVSPSTVSRALSRPDLVKEETREQILAAALELGYVVNGSARALARRSTNSIGAVVPRFGTSSFSATVQAMESTLAEAGFTLLLSAPEHDLSREPSMVRTLLERGVDALALLGADHTEETYTLLARHNIPYVLLWAQSAGGLAPGIGFDDDAAGELVVAHLHALGHRRLGFISGEMRGNERARRRFDGTMKAMSKRGITLCTDAFIETPYSFAHGFEAMHRIIERRSAATAIICGNDYLAAGALSACNEAGVDVPGSISVASYNDNEFAAYLWPPLTTVHLPIEEMGRAAAGYLVDRLQGRDPAPPGPLPIDMIIRRSTGPAPA
ncbi:MAG: LacI family DNA-binding transcriptional regulator [Aquisalimonadaceae bacterium]